MASGAAADGFLRCGCISSFDSVVERRPYHKNCSCALHGSKNGGCSGGSGKCKSVSYPIRRSWSEGSLALAAAAGAASPSPSQSPGSSPALPVAPPGKNRHRRLGSSACIEIEES